MAKAKYKIGTYIKHTTGAGEVTAIITRNEGHSYEVDNSDLVEEHAVVKSFREMKTRAAKTRTTKSSKKKNNTETQASVQ